MSKYANHIVRIFGRSVAQKPHGNANTLLHLKSQMNNINNFREMSIRGKLLYITTATLLNLFNKVPSLIISITILFQQKSVFTKKYL